MSVDFLKDKRLSWKAKGILSYFFFSGEKDFSVRRLADMAKDGPSGVNAGLKELESCGLLKIKMVRGQGGKFCGSEYVLQLKESE